MSMNLHGVGLQCILAGLFDGSFSGTPTLIGPWGGPTVLPRHQGLTDSSNEACRRQTRDHSRADAELQSARVTSKEFWLPSIDGGVKRRPLWEAGEARPAFEYSSVYRLLVLSAGDVQRRCEGGDCSEFSISKRRKDAVQWDCKFFRQTVLCKLLSKQSFCLFFVWKMENYQRTLNFLI